LIIFIVTIVLVAILLVLAYPFVMQRSGRGMVDDAAAELAQRLRRSRDRIYEEIRALQQEYFLDNLTEGEYQGQLQTARLEAANLMRQQQQVQQMLSDVEAAVEQELREIATEAGNEPEGESP
jgi:Tfp pilus assembly protein FimT